MIAWRAFRTAMRLGWQIESNWADPLLFLIYSVAKPVGAALILVFMVDIISGGRADPGIRSFVVIGVMPERFWFGGMDAPIWTRLDERRFGFHAFGVGPAVGRLDGGLGGVN